MRGLSRGKMKKTKNATDLVKMYKDDAGSLVILSYVQVNANVL